MNAQDSPGRFAAGAIAWVVCERLAWDLTITTLLCYKHSTRIKQGERGMKHPRGPAKPKKPKKAKKRGKGWGTQRVPTLEQELSLMDLQALIFSDHIRRKGQFGPRTHDELAEVADLHPTTVKKIAEGLTTFPMALTEHKLYKACGVRRNLVDIETGRTLDMRRYYEYIPKEFRRRRR
jgi:hypothetical protein